MRLKSFLTSFLPFLPFSFLLLFLGTLCFFINLILCALGLAKYGLFWVVLEGKKFSYPLQLESELFPDYSVRKNVKVSLHKMEGGISKSRCSSLCPLFHSLEKCFSTSDECLNFQVICGCIGPIPQNSVLKLWRSLSL